MKVLFVSTKTSIATGSYRIWVKDLSNYMNKIGVQTEINSKCDASVVILGKENRHHIDYYRRKMPNAKIGLINPSPQGKIKADFIIAGSIEEMDSLSKYKNVFLYPLIEGMFEDQPLKVHKKVSPSTIGFHGHYPHLSKLNPYFKPALEEFSKERDICIKVITGPQDFEWSKSKPKIKIKIVPWHVNTIKNEIGSCDIGIIPNITYLKTDIAKSSIHDGLYDTDYTIRFKNKSNAGRLFVFMQMGVPVIADITPSNLHLLGDPECGYAVLSKEGCLNGLRWLSDPSNRSKMAQKARKEFNRLYNPITWTERLVRQINGL